MFSGLSISPHSHNHKTGSAVPKPQLSSSSSPWVSRDDVLPTSSSPSPSAAASADDLGALFSGLQVSPTSVSSEPAAALFSQAPGGFGEASGGGGTGGGAAELDLFSGLQSPASASGG